MRDESDKEQEIAASRSDSSLIPHPSSLLSGRRVLVMGLGLHNGGLGVARFLVEQGADVTVTDLRSAEVLKSSVEALEGLPIKLVLGEHREEDFRQADIVIRNPAVPRNSKYLEIARQAGASIEMEFSLFFRLCSSDFILGITGTRGKTTTTMLAGAIMQAWRPETVIAGNLRVSALAQLDKIQSGTPVVLELSSWQLEGLDEAGISPKFAAITNMSPDHLNRYRDMADYADAKRAIYRHQDKSGVIVLNAEDELVNTFYADAPGSVVWFAEDAETFTEKVPMLVNPPALHYGILNGQFVQWDNEFSPQPIAPVSALKLPGRHNRLNALAALALVKSAGCPNEAIRQGLENFGGVPDRLEVVRELNGVQYINDTTSTSPAATVAALEALQSDGHNRRIVLIAGGADKQLEFGPMVWAIANPANRVESVVMLEGSATERLTEELIKTKYDRRLIHGPYSNFRTAIKTAKQAARPGDIVLLSPGCASFGMFTHEFERGERFREIVNSL